MVSKEELNSLGDSQEDVELREGGRDGGKALGVTGHCFGYQGNWKHGMAVLGCNSLEDCWAAVPVRAGMTVGWVFGLGRMYSKKVMLPTLC